MNKLLKTSAGASSLAANQMKIVLVPEWVQMAVKKANLSKETVLDTKILSTILSVDDVIFYEYMNSCIPKYLSFTSVNFADVIGQCYVPHFSANVERYGRHLGKADAPEYWNALFAQHYEPGNEFAICAEIIGGDTLMLAFNQTDAQSLEYVFNKNNPNSVTLAHNPSEAVPPQKVCELMEIIFKVFSDHGKFDDFVRSSIFPKWCKFKRGLA